MTRGYTKDGNVISDEIMKWKDVVDQLSGLSTETVTFIKRLTAQDRHEWRIQKTIEAVCGTADPHALGAFLIVADLCGIGGYLGVSGDATARLPVFRNIGSGRKHARDGAAWMAAANEAAYCCPVGARIRIDDGKIVVVDGALEAVIEDDLVPKAWQKSVACAALRALARAERHLYGFVIDGDVSDWAKFIEYVSKDEEDEEQKEDVDDNDE